MLFFIIGQLAYLSWKGVAAMGTHHSYVIKSFKHDGHLHRMWLENWLVPNEVLDTRHAEQSMLVLINSRTKIQESDGKQWVSKIPGVSFFIPGQWFNIVALVEEHGIRYYCNIASPPYVSGHVVTYIDYDLDVILTPDGITNVVDREEYELHRMSYHYSALVEAKVEEGLNELLRRIDSREAPFQDELVLYYYENWKKNHPISEV